MFATIINKAKRLPFFVAAACGIAMAAASVPAFATDGDGMSTVWDVFTSPTYLRIHLTNNPNDFYSYPTTPPGCPTWTQTPEQVRFYTNMAQTALLSGKQLRITYNTCPANGVKHIDHMEIFAN